MSYLITGWGGRIRTSAWRHQNPLAPPLLQGRRAGFVLLCLSRQTGGDGGTVGSLLSCKEQTGFVFVPCADPEAEQNIIIELATQTLPSEGYSPDDIQILSPIKKPSVLCGCRELNAELRKRLNRPEHRVVVGDRVIQTKNDRERNIFNGELGIVARTDDEGFDVLFGD